MEEWNEVEEGLNVSKFENRRVMKWGNCRDQSSGNGNGLNSTEHCRSKWIGRPKLKVEAEWMDVWESWPVW